MHYCNTHTHTCVQAYTHQYTLIHTFMRGWAVYITLTHHDLNNIHGVVMATGIPPLQSNTHICCSPHTFICSKPTTSMIINAFKYITHKLMHAYHSRFTRLDTIYRNSGVNRGQLFKGIPTFLAKAFTTTLKLLYNHRQHSQILTTYSRAAIQARDIIFYCQGTDDGTIGSSHFSSSLYQPPC